MIKHSKIALLLLFLYGYGGTIRAQVNPDQGKYAPDYDTAYIKDYRHRLNLSYVSEIKVNGIGILTPTNDVLLYQTNLALPQHGFMATYRWLNVQLTLPVPGISVVQPNKGETKALAFAVGLTTRRFYARAFYEKFTGYFMRNPQVLFPGFSSNQPLLFPDMTSQTVYGTLYFGPNGKKYSHRSLLWQSEIQKRSAGSLLVGATGGVKQISSSKDILPGPIPTNANEARYVLLGVTVGYAYTLVLGKNFNTSLAVLPGLNYILGSYTETGNEEVIFNQDFGLNTEARWQILYQNERFYAGLSFTTYFLTDFIDQDYPVGSAHNYLKMNIGYRFVIKPKKFLEPLNLSN